MLNDKILELAASLGVDISLEPNPVVTLNDIRILLEIVVKQHIDKESVYLYNLVKDNIEVGRNKYKDMTNDEYFDFLYGECTKNNPEKALALREYLFDLGETVKNSVENGSAPVKGTLEDGVNEIITDVEKAIIEDAVEPVEVGAEVLKERITSSLSEIVD